MGLLWEKPQKEGKNMKNLYILLMRSDTTVSRIIYALTRETYTHSALSFSDDMSVLFSFGRKNPDRLFPAGLVTESLQKGVMARCKNSPCVILQLSVSDEAYRRAKAFVNACFNQHSVYRYDILGLVCCKWNREFNRENYFFCSQFVATVLRESGCVKLAKSPSLIHPVDFLLLPGVKKVYEGTLGDCRAMWEPPYALRYGISVSQNT